MRSAVEEGGHEVLNPFVTLEDIEAREREKGLSDAEIYERDMALLERADALVAEVSAPSLGVGYEIGTCRERDVPVLCLARTDAQGVSAMVAGDYGLTLKRYIDTGEMKAIVAGFLRGRAGGSGPT